VQHYSRASLTSLKKSIFFIVVFSVFLFGAYSVKAEPQPPPCDMSISCSGPCFASANTCSANNGVQSNCAYTAYSLGGACDPTPVANQSCTTNHCSSGFTCSGGSCVPLPPPTPNCNTGISCAECSAPANTCSSGNGSQSCVYTAHTSGNACNQVGAPSQSCTRNNCSSGLICSPGGYCTPPNCDINPVCYGSCSAPANTCSSGNGTQNNCSYTAYSGGGNNCFNVPAPNQSCTTNNCSSDLICSSGACIPPPGQITIAKHAVGGSGTFNFTGNIGITSLTVLTPSTTFSQTVSVPPGSNYNISEIVPAGWTQTSATCTNGTPSAITVVSNQNTTCLFTNTKSGSLTIVKNTTGGNDTFSFTVSGNGYSPIPLSFTTVGGTNTYIVDNIQPGSGYTITEADNPIWNLTSSSCTKSNGTSAGPISGFTIETGSATTCTFNNTIKPGQITIEKNTVGGDGTFTFTGTTSITSITVPSGATTKSQTASKPPGTYTISEDSVAGWTQTSATCTNGTPSAIIVTPNQTTTCTFTNTKKGHIIVVKDASPNDAQDFSFTNNFANGNPASFSLDDDSDGTLPNSRDFEVIPGTYNLSESSVTAWFQTSAICSDGSPITAVAVSAGETVTCTFRNAEAGFIRVTKNTTGGDGTFPLTISGNSLGPVTSSVTTSSGTGDYYSSYMPPGTYTIKETVPAGWIQTSSSCDAINVYSDGTSPCSMANKKLPKIEFKKKLIPSTDTGKFKLQMDGTTLVSDVGDGGTTGGIYTTVGTHTLSEAAGTGTDLLNYNIPSFGGDCTGTGTSTTITLNYGDDKICTITNTKGTDTARLTVNLVVVPSTDTGKFNPQMNYNNMATDVGNGWSSGEQWHYSGSTETIGQVAGTGTDLTNYTTTFSGDCNPNGSVAYVTLNAGDHKTCTITNTRKGGVTVTKNTTGGEGNFEFVLNSITGPPIGPIHFNIDTTSGNRTNTIPLPAGSYKVDETVPSGWTQTYSTCGDGTFFDVTLGNIKNCHVDNTQVAATGSIKLVKTLIYQSSATGGTFTFTGNTSITSITVPSGQSTTSKTVSVATGSDYSLTESYSSGWKILHSSCKKQDGTPTGLASLGSIGNITIEANKTTTCNFTNANYQLPTLTIKELTVPSSDLGKFNIQVGGNTVNNGSNVTNGASVSLWFYPPTTVTVGETAGSDTNLSDYTTKYSGDCDATTHKVTLNLGDDKTCTITNTKIVTSTGSIKIVKNTVGGNGTFGFTGNFGTIPSFTTSGSPGTDNHTINNIALGSSYTIAESTIPSGWSQTSVSCVKQDGTPTGLASLGSIGNITVEANKTTTCTFTNTKSGFITITKNTVGGNGTFSFTVSGNGYGPFAQSITTNSSGTGTYTLNNMLPGTYTITESVPAGWTKGPDTCSSVTLGTGGSASCSVTNTKKGHIIVVKDAVPNDAQDFAFSNNFGNGSPASFSLDDDTNGTLPNSRDFEVLPSSSGGTYSVSEAAVTGWTSTPTNCSDGSPINAIAVAAGEIVTCTFTNTKSNGSITIIINSNSNSSTDICWDGDLPDVNGPAGPGDLCLDDDDTNQSLPNSWTWEDLIPDTYYSFERISGSGEIVTGITCAEDACDEVLYGSNGSYTHPTWQPGDTGFKVKAQQ